MKSPRPCSGFVSEAASFAIGTGTVLAVDGG